MSNKSISVNFTFEKETPGTHRYKESVKDGENPKIGTLYLKKDFVNESFEERPKSLTITIENK